MSLLVDMLADAQDPSYAAAARRHPPGAGPDVRPGPSGGRRVGGLLLLVLVGLATGTAAAGVRSRNGDTESTRRSLVAEIQRRSQDAERLGRDLTALRAEVSDQRRAALDADAEGRELAGRLRAAEVAGGLVAMTGPGVVVTINDRPDRLTGPTERGGQVGSGRVADRDLQQVANGLWAAGAEAVSINDLRLTARTAIRSAGEAVLVDFRPLSPPYVVRAIGDGAALRPDFEDSPAGRRLATWANINGIAYDVASEPTLQVPAGSVVDPVAATAGPS